MKKLIQDDIIKSINDNLAVENITVQDAQKLRRYTHKLYQHIYSHYEEMEELNEMTDESLMLDIDIIEKKHEEEMSMLEKELKVVIAEKDDVIAEKDDVIAEKDDVIAEKDDAIAEKDKEIQKLKAALEQAGIQV